MHPIKLLHTADIHIGMENYGRIDPATGINARVMDFLRRLTDMADYAIDQDVERRFCHGRSSDREFRVGMNRLSLVTRTTGTFEDS